MASPAWERKRQRKLKDVGFRCQDCGTKRRLEVHHLTYARLGKERLKDLRALCHDCHKKRHGHMRDEDDMLDFNTRNPAGRLGFLLDAAIRAENEKQPPREYLGASRIGENCARKLQYEYFRTPKDKPFTGQTLRIFYRGHQSEAWMIRWLRMSGFDLRTENADGGQFGFVTAGGKLRGHADGVFVGGPDEFGPWPRLWECKCLGAKGWNKLEKERLKKAHPVYYAQVQLYMAYFQLTDNPALFTALNADTMEIYAESVPFDGACAQEMSDKAVKVLAACAAGEILPRVAQREDWFECKWCDYAVRCWHG